MKKAVILLSGGLDSATVAAMATKQGFKLYAMSFSYNQRHTIEVEAAKKSAIALECREHKIITIDLATFGESSLTSDIEIPKDRDGSETDIPNTYVPARNTIFLSYAMAYAEVLESQDVFIGVTAVDYSGYPDCRPDYIAAFQAMANLATRAGREGHPLTIHTPLINLSKAQIITEGTALGVDYSLTHSCYDPNKTGASCGQCDSCLHRHRGFVEAGILDPTRYSAPPRLI